MESNLTHKPHGRQGGYVLVAVAALTTVLLATGIAYMRWSTDEAAQSREVTAAMQAYYLAQMGVVEEGFMWLRSQKETDLPTGDLIRPGKRISFGADDQTDGQYTEVHVYGMPGINQGGGFWLEDRRFRISAVGKVRIPYFQDGHDNYKDVERKAVLYVQERNFADYMYLSDCEITNFGDRIKFWHGDTLQGRVHSNSQIAIEQDPVFYGQVSSTACDFWETNGATPHFLGPPPVFRAPYVQIPSLAANLRSGAAQQGHFFTRANTSYHVSLRGGVAVIFSWPTGTPYDTTTRNTVPIVGLTCIFCDGPTELEGCLTGQLTVGSSGILRLVDDVRYSDLCPDQWRYAPNTNSYNILGIVSEADVKVGNTYRNGRNDSNNHGLGFTNQDSASVRIDGAIVALGESFTFEQQNDADSGYVYQYPPGTNHVDDRGTIYLFGSVTQKRRGYVHRSTPPNSPTGSSTGYLKQYVYDFRFDRIKPPCFFHVTDSTGRAIFNIVQWGSASNSDKTDHQNELLPRFN